MLSRVERMTLASYARIAASRPKTHGDPNFLLPEFQTFDRLLRTWSGVGSVLDLGCGHGRDAALFFDRGYHYVGLDFSRPMLEEADKLVPRSCLVEGSMYDLPFPDATFDGLWAVGSLLHIPSLRVREVLREMHRIMCSGGIGFILMHDGQEEALVEVIPKLDVRYFVGYRMDYFARILEEIGFVVLSKDVVLKPGDKRYQAYFIERSV